LLEKEGVLMAAGERRAAKDALFDGFASVAKALASGRRAEIIELLAQGERTVEAIADEIGQSIANTSHHLRTLARAGLVSTRRTGTHVHYRLASDDVLQLWWAMRRVAAAQVDGLDDLARRYLGNREHIPTLTGEDLLERLDRGDVVIVDVRPEAEYLAGHLPGAVHVPPDQLQLLDDLPPDRDVIAYCRGPYCVYADDAVRRRQAQGRRAARLEAGIPEWRSTGGPVEP
jgi:rhodanese-related sulfurtransferase/predicted transcriptional regulator